MRRGEWVTSSSKTAGSRPAADLNQPRVSSGWLASSLFGQFEPGSGGLTGLRAVQESEVPTNGGGE